MIKYDIDIDIDVTKMDCYFALTSSLDMLQTQWMTLINLGTPFWLKFFKKRKLEENYF